MQLIDINTIGTIVSNCTKEFSTRQELDNCIKKGLKEESDKTIESIFGNPCYKKRK